MAAGLALGTANVTFTPAEGEPTTWLKVGILVRLNRLRVSQRGGGLLAESLAVSAVEQVAKREWRVTTPDGVYQVVRDKNCGCGG